MISQILTIEQVSELLNVRPSWVYARTCDGKLRGTGRGRRSARKGSAVRPHPMEAVERMPCFKLGRLLRFDRDEVLRWLESLHRNGSEPTGTQPKGDFQTNENKQVTGAC